MKQLEAIRILHHWDKKGRCIFSRHDLMKLFSTDSKKTFDEGLHRIVKSGILQRACRGVYVNRDSVSFDQHVIEKIAKILRPGSYNYISLESMLSEYGVISQILVDRLTVMTTGREGVYKTPYGVIEMTHTKRSVEDILKNTKFIQGRPLRIATKEAAIRDLKRVGRNLKLMKAWEF